MVAVASRNEENARYFGRKFGISQVYGSYEELAKDSDVGKYFYTKKDVIILGAHMPVI